MKKNRKKKIEKKKQLSVYQHAMGFQNFNSIQEIFGGPNVILGSVDQIKRDIK